MMQVSIGVSLKISPHMCFFQKDEIPALKNHVRYRSALLTVVNVNLSHYTVDVSAGSLFSSIETH